MVIFGAESQEARNSALEFFKGLRKFGHHRIAAHGNTSHHVLQDVQRTRGAGGAGGTGEGADAGAELIYVIYDLL